MRRDDVYRGRNDEPFDPGQRAFADRMRSRSWNTPFREKPVPMKDRPFRPLDDDRKGILGLVKTLALIILVCGLAIAVPAWIGTNYTARLVTSMHGVPTVEAPKAAEQEPEKTEGAVEEFIESLFGR